MNYTRGNRLPTPGPTPAVGGFATPASVILGGGGWIRTTEARASDLQSDPFGHSGTPPEGRTFSRCQGRVSTLNFTLKIPLYACVCPRFEKCVRAVVIFAPVSPRRLRLDGLRRRSRPRRRNTTQPGDSSGRARYQRKKCVEKKLSWREDPNLVVIWNQNIGVKPHIPLFALGFDNRQWVLCLFITAIFELR